jgi:hypothetical protein
MEEEFCSDVEIYDAHTGRGYEKVYCLHHQCILGEQVSLPSRSKKESIGVWL